MQPYESLPARIRAKIQLPEDLSDCWPWTGYVSKSGYGRIFWDGVVREAHRIVYAILNEPIPDGLVLDHTCHDPEVCKGKGRECPHRRCQNPGHASPVTRGANALRGSSPPALNAQSDSCDKGHLYMPGSFRIEDGHRRCLICRRETDKRRRPRGVPRSYRTATSKFHPKPDFPASRIPS